MNTPVFYRRHAERFSQLLDEADGGRRHHTRSPLDDELAELVGLGHQLSAARPAVDVDPGFRTGLRAVLIATAEREGIGATATAISRGPDSLRRPGQPDPARRPLRPVLNGRRARARVAIIAGVAVGAIAVSGISTASENSLPGDAFYGMKRSTERAQLALSGSDLGRGQLFLDFARTRLGEAEALLDDSDGFAMLLDDMDADTRQGVKLLTTSAVQDKDEQPLDAITAFLAGQRGHLRELFDHTTGVEHQRVAASDALLDAVATRVEILRRTLACGADPSGRADVLGPLPHACTTGSGPSGTPSGSRQRDQQPDQETAAPALPSPASTAAIPGTGAGATPRPTTEQPIPTPNGNGNGNGGGRRPLSRALG